MKKLRLPSLLLFILISSCASDTEETDKETSIDISTDQEEQLGDVVEEPEVNQAINEENKILYDALVPLGSGIRPKEMNLAEEGYRILPKGFIGVRSGVDYTLYADYSIDQSGNHAVIIRVKSFHPDEIEVFQSDVQYFLVAFDKSWNITDRKKIHAENSSDAESINSSGWCEMDSINIAWLKLTMVEGKIMTSDEETATFEGSEEGILEAKQFVTSLHRK